MHVVLESVGQHEFKKGTKFTQEFPVAVLLFSIAWANHQGIQSKRIPTISSPPDLPVAIHKNNGKAPRWAT
jgi:hypothetical protein